MNNHKKDRILSILNPGDTVVSVTEHVIAVRNINGETRVLWYRIDENGLPRLDGKSLRNTALSLGSFGVLFGSSGKSQFLIT